MPKVEVDSEDLEALIYASAVIKTIEGQLASFRRDPFMKDAGEKFLPAQKRLESAWRNAKRAAAPENMLININDPPTDQDKLLLLGLWRRKDQYGFVRVARHVGQASMMGQKSSMDSLTAKGLIDLGDAIYGGRFTGDEHPVMLIDIEHYMVRFTRKGGDLALELEKSGG